MQLMCLKYITILMSLSCNIDCIALLLVGRLGAHEDCGVLQTESPFWSSHLMFWADGIALFVQDQQPSVGRWWSSVWAAMCLMSEATLYFIFNIAYHNTRNNYTTTVLKKYCELAWVITMGITRPLFPETLFLEFWDIDFFAQKSELINLLFQKSSRIHFSSAT